MKKILLLLFTFNAFAQAPNIEWQKSIGGTQTDSGNSVIQTNDGGYIAVGATLSSDIIPLGNYHGDYDVYVVKTNNLGNIEWQKTIGGSGYDVGISIIETNDNGYIIAGYTSSSDGDITSNNGQFDGLVIKLDSIGTIIWQKTYGGSSRENFYSIVQTSDGGYILSGTSISNDGQVAQNYGSIDCWVVKINDLGIIEWEKNYGGSSEEFIVDIKEISNNGYIFVGHSFSNNVDITTNQGSCDAWIVKINNLGVIEWQKTYGGSEQDYLYNIQQTPDGGFVICGQTESSNGDIQNAIHGDLDSWIMKLDTSGNIIWSKTYGGSNLDSFNKILQTPTGEYILAGNTYSNDFDLAGNYGDSDIWIIKVSSIGELIWQKNIGGSNNDYINDIIKTQDNGYALIGSSNSNNFDLNSNHGALDILIMKLSAEQLSNHNFQSLNLLVSPNPSSNFISIQVPSENLIDSLFITDVTGKKMIIQSNNPNQINIESLAKGTYIIQAVSENKTYQTKFIKE